MDKIICVFGASIIWGAWDTEKGGWANRLKLSLESSTVYSLGISSERGEATDSLLERFKSEAKIRKADIVIFAIGINDSFYINSEDNPRVSLENFWKNLSKLVNQAREIGSKVIFVGLTKIDESKTSPIPGNRKVYYTNENIKRYNSVIENFCKENKIDFISMLDLLNKEDLADGLHPNSQGHQKMFERVRDFLLENKLVGK